VQCQGPATGGPFVAGALGVTYRITGRHAAERNDYAAG